MSIEREPDVPLLRAIQVDVRRLYDTWMAVAFPRQREAEHSVLGRWRPETSRDKAVYWVWAAVGVPLIVLCYPLAVLGFAARFYTRRFDSAQSRLGLLGVVLVSVLIWGLLIVATYLGLTARAVLAVGGASVVATFSAVLAVMFTRWDGRPVTVLLAYPFAVTAIFLPPVVAALYSPSVAEAVLPGSDRLAVYLLNDVLPGLPLGERASSYLRTNYELVGAAYALMWFAIAVPVGWLLGIIVTLADLIRPHPEEEPSGGAES